MARICGDGAIMERWGGVIRADFWVIFVESTCCIICSENSLAACIMLICAVMSKE